MLSIHLQNLKSAGVYRFVFDKSEVTNTYLETMRLVVGYSEKGNFNTVTYVKNEQEFREIYGGISKKLEKYGCFFHRLALQCLAKGPILCLNLKKFQPKDDTHTQPNVEGGYEAVYGLSISPYNDSEVSSTSAIEVAKIFNTNRLWTLDPEVLPSAFTTANFMSIAQTDAKKCSDTVFIRPSSAKGYDVTLRDWYNNYNNGEYPDYVEGALDSLVSDYMVDVYIFRGKFTPEIACSSTFADYFDTTGTYVRDYIINAYGEKEDALAALAQVDGSGFLSAYSGVLLPYFKNTDGSWMSIDLVVNNDVASHNVMMYLDESKLEDGTTNIAAINVAGYNQEDWLELGTCGTNRPCYGTDNIARYMYNVWKQTSTTDTTWILDDSKTENDFTYGDIAVDVFRGIGETGDTASFSAGTFTWSAAKPQVCIASSAPIAVGDRFIASKKLPKEVTSGTWKLEGDTQDMSIVTVLEIENKTLSNVNCYIITFNGWPAVVKPSTSGIDDFCLIRYNSKLTVHAATTFTAHTTGDDATATVFTNDAHKGVYLEGYTYLDPKPTSTSPANKLSWINNRFEVLAEKGIREALTNCTDVDYRYIVDTFEGLPESGLRAKLCKLASEKKNAFVLSNFPSVKTFCSTGDKAFLDSKGVFNTKYVAAGHNKSINTTYNISMPTEANGAAYIAFYTPLRFNDNGLKINVPSAGLVSNNFMTKYTSRQPYYVVAGPSYGLMTYDDLIGPDYNFTRDDLDNLEPMGVNCMVYKPQRGTFINANQTAKQIPVTGLSKVNIVELVIYLQDVIADMLQGYQWELNTKSLRDAIKAKADAVCEKVQTNGGLYDFENISDESNNTDEVIDNEMIILSTSIEPAKGAGKMVHELTIYKKGGMSSVIK